MAGHERHAEAAPLTGAAGPNIRLVADGGDAGETRIECRRVISLIGSRSGCKVRLRHPHVSSVHAAVVNDGTHAFAVDFCSPTGTLLNGRKMEHERLGHGDVLGIAAWEFRVELEEPNHDTQSDIHPFPLDASPHALAIEHLESGRVLYPNRDLCTLGRKSGCDIVIPDNRVSRIHALLLNYCGHPAICDLLSQNHTWVNDDPIAFRMLENDDILTLGDSRFRVRLVGSAVVEKAARENNGTSTAVTSQKPVHPPDEINIEETESSQRWHVADQISKAG